MKKIALVGLVVLAAIVIISSFFMPWAQLSTSVTKVSKQLTGSAGQIKNAPFGERFARELSRITDAIGNVGGDIQIKTSISGYDIPSMANKKSSKVAISLVQGLLKDAKDINKKAALVFLLPIFAVVCVALAVMGLKNKLSVILMLIISGAISLGGLYRLKTLDLASLPVDITIEKGLWQTLYAYLFIFIVSIIWLVTDKKQASGK
ncbi:MAG: hypothetical protein Q8O36_00830 [Candidatus Omnitrophota bacterium]|nr:hypothetical protein [Candidatus Omnitrophota bacterium]